LTHAFPFLEFMRSATSRLRARFGSKYCGSQALSKGNQYISHPGCYSVLHMYRCSVDFGSAGSPKLPPKRSLEAMRAEAASILLERTVSPPPCLAIKSQMSEGLSGGLRATVDVSGGPSTILVPQPLVDLMPIMLQKSCSRRVF
jgi:hypothetical protein